MLGAVNPPLSHVMIVDDGEDDASVLSHLLEKAGLHGSPLVFRKGEAAMEHLQSVLANTESRALPKAVFVDVSLPGMTGFDFARWVRNQAELRSVALILLSGTEEPRNIGKAAQLGADCYLIKFPPPSVMRELFDQIRNQIALPWPRAAIPNRCNLLAGRAA